ncbi:MAG: hypothetical protein NZ529_11785 [Cytophagaceae bacterium]|nr:hypothetical protein [Cytophagaceae bacterium]MDW8457464.1 hypothetical protein [Cytophagaceae bacterium]
MSANFQSGSLEGTTLYWDYPTSTHKSPTNFSSKPPTNPMLYIGNEKH